MIQPDAFMPDDLIRNRNWADLSAEEKEALKDIAATEEEFRLLKLMLHTPVEPAEAIPAINPAVQERLKTAFRNEHAPRARVISWWRYAAAAAIVLAVAGTIWIISGNHKKETGLAREEKTKPVQPIIKPDTVQPGGNDTLLIPETPPARNPPIEHGPVKPPRMRKPPVKPAVDTPVQQLPAINREPSVAVNINTSVKENSELLQLVAAVY